MSNFIRVHLGAMSVLLALVAASDAFGAAEDGGALKFAAVETVVVTGERTEKAQPNSVEHVTAAKAHEQINAVNTEDMLKYLPSIVVRKRHYGDTQDPIATRTSGVGASARSLLYVDGILVSSLIGNNNTTASPHFGVAEPDDISAIDVLYGPFAAEYAGNSIGAVVNITTRMPDHFEVYADVLGAVQPFRQYGTHRTYGTGRASAEMGDRSGGFSWRLSANHLDSTGQPLAYVTLAQPAAPGGGGTVVTGGFNGLNRSGAPIAIIGAGGIEHQVEDTGTLKLAYDFTNQMQLTYTVSLFHQTDNASAQSYLRDGTGNPVYAGSVDFGGFAYNIGPSSFSNNVYHWHQTHLAQGVSLKSAPGDFQWEIVGSDYAYLADNQRVPGTALPAARSGGAGTINRLNGTGWYTLDAKAIWSGWDGNELSFGAHRDSEAFDQRKFATADWIDGDAGALLTQAKGRTATDALWLQDIWSFAPAWKLTAGARYENWHAYDARNFSAAPPLNVTQPHLSGDFLSPKASLAWQPAEDWALRASYGSAYRMPTVTELYQAITTGADLTVPNPDLKPEHANTAELSAERQTEDGRIRLSLFQENVTNALVSQSAPLVPGSTTLFSFVQNVPRTRARGVEFVVDQNDVFIDGLELYGGVTYVDGRTLRDPAFPAAEGKRTPQLPRWRASAMATYRPNDIWSFMLSARYSGRAFGTIDNSDPVSNTFQGFSRYFVMDTRIQYRIDERWTASLGVDNLNNDKYFLFHPFSQRSFLMEIHYAQ